MTTEKKPSRSRKPKSVEAEPEAAPAPRAEKAPRTRKAAAPTKERRSRKAAAAPEEAAPAKSERRLGDRRESPRLPIPVQVRVPNGKFIEVQGDISVGGVLFVDTRPLKGRRVDLRFRLPGRDAEVRVRGEVVETSEKGEGLYGAHVRFEEIDLETQRAIARFIDTRS